MRRGSNCTISITASDIDEDAVESVHILIKQKGLTISLEATLEDEVATAELDEDTTRLLRPGRLWLQVVAETTDGSIVQSSIIRYNIADSLIDKRGLTDGISSNGFILKYFD